MKNYNYGIQFPPKTMGIYSGPHWWVMSVVEIRHKKTGLKALSYEERSQKMNKVMALRKLRALLAFNDWDGEMSVDVGIVKAWTWTPEEGLKERGSP